MVIITDSLTIEKSIPARDALSLPRNELTLKQI